MRRLRLKPDGTDKFQIFIPGENRDYPIGTVWRQPFANPPKWKIKPYFMARVKDDPLLNHTYDDSVLAARALVDLYNHIEMISKMDITQPYEFIFPDDYASD